MWVYGDFFPFFQGERVLGFESLLFLEIFFCDRCFSLGSVTIEFLPGMERLFLSFFFNFKVKDLEYAVIKMGREFVVYFKDKLPFYTGLHFYLW